MKERMKQILNKIHEYNQDHVAQRNFGLSEDVIYDALVIAPSYSPQKLIRDEAFQITQLESSGLCACYLIEKSGMKIAWLRTMTGACNMVDYLLLCGELQFRKLFFVGATGALRPEIEIGDVCTPAYSIAGTMANAYLKDTLRDFVPFEKVYPDGAYTDRAVKLAEQRGYPIKKASVFCTDSIAMEYSHLDEIKAFGTDLIEMETAAFYEIAQMMEVPAIALLVVSDNSAAGIPLWGRSDEQQYRYRRARETVLVDVIETIVQKM